jgi:hypothetical protein
MGKASTGKTGIGVLLKIGDGASPEVFATVANVTTMSVGGVTLNTVDATHLNSPNFYQEFIAGLKSGDEWTFTTQWDPSDPTQSGTTGLRAKLESRLLTTFRVDTSAIGLHISLECDAFVSAIANIDISPENIMTQQVTLRPSGAPREVDNA